MEDLCTSCLCAGRKLYFLSETGFEHLYSQIINEIPIYNMSDMCVRICWECKALLRKIEKFKDQVKKCYFELLQYVQQNALRPFPDYSHLQIHQITNCSYPPLNDNLTVKEEIDEHSFLDDGVALVDDDQAIKNDDFVVKIEEPHCEPEAFVNDFNLHNIIERSEKKGDKQKLKKKLKNEKHKGIKKKVKIKKKSLEQAHTGELTSRTVESLINTTVLNSYKQEEDIIEQENKTPDKIQLGKEMNDLKIAVKIHKNYNIKKKLPKLVNKDSVSDPPFCAECGKVFSSRKTYRYHLNVLHNGQNRHPCPLCGKIYQWKSNLARHLRSHKARDTGELFCEACDKHFASVATYKQHLRISKRHVSESEFNYMCNECGKKFVSKTRLRDHIDWEHLKKIKFKCQLCNKAFKCHTSLYVHLQNVHNSKNKKQNLCHVCGKSYQNAAKLKYHIVAMHTSETPYQCSRCSAAFGWYSSLYRHVREVHYKLKLQSKKSKKQKKEVLPSLLPVMPTILHSGHV